MASIYLKVEYADGSERTVRVGPKAQVLYERRFDDSFFSDARIRVERQFFMAWAALDVAGDEPGEFDDWLGGIEAVRAETDTPNNPVDDRAVNPEVDPTQKAQQPDI